jgi:hypothetical protein
MSIFFNFRVSLICLLIVLSGSLHSKCFGPNWAFLDNSDRKIKIAALGYMYFSDSSAIFKPFLCLNIEKCVEVNFSDYPNYELNFGMNAVWRNKQDLKKSHMSKEMLLLYTKDNNFESAIKAQKDFVYKYKPQYLISRIDGYDEDDCPEDEKTSVMVKEIILFYEKSIASIEYEKEINLYYAKYSEEKMKGCGCEKLFYPNKIEHFLGSSNLRGKFIRKGKKLFFVNLIYGSNNIPVSSRTIELINGDKCNFFVSDFLGREVFIDLYEKLNIKKTNCHTLTLAKM